VISTLLSSPLYSTQPLHTWIFAGSVMTREIVDRLRSSTPWTADHDKKATIPQTASVLLWLGR
jgi:hypothetical protein